MHLSTIFIKLQLFALLLILSNNCLGQKEGRIWYFGNKAGLDFSTNPPTILSNGQLNTFEGCASIADKVTGQLLFYTDGTTAWGKNHLPMPSLPTGGLGGHTSSTQSGVIVPDPANPNGYYVFTTTLLAAGPMYWAKVDMTLNGGNGDIVTSKIPMLSFPCEKIASIGNCTLNEYWVLAHKFQSDSFYAYKVTAGGIGLPVISKIGTLHGGVTTNNFESLGYMKFSPSGKKIALAIHRKVNVIEVLDFDVNSGLLSNPITDTFQNAYGCSFSPDNSKLYFSNDKKIIQYDMSSNVGSTILASRNDIATINEYGALQNGINGVMYHSGNRLASFLNVIQNPNALGNACGFIANGQSLGTGISELGLPGIVETFLQDETTEILPPESATSCAFATAILNVPPNYNISIIPVQFVTANSDSSQLTFSPPTTTTYTVYYQTKGLCGNMDSIVFTVAIGTKAIADFDINPTITTISNPVFNFNNKSTNATQYAWYYNGQQFSSLINPTITLTDTGKHCFTLVASNDDGCVDSIIKCANIEPIDIGVFIPNAFSPNGDGINNTFHAIYDGSIEFVNLVVYNRWGQRIFFTKNAFEDWDGKFKGSLCDIGVYFYMFNYKKKGSNDIICLKGDVQLLR
jgi:gliding motility-associated-like protein